VGAGVGEGVGGGGDGQLHSSPSQPGAHESDSQAEEPPMLRQLAAVSHVAGSWPTWQQKSSGGGVGAGVGEGVTGGGGGEGAGPEHA